MPRHVYLLGVGLALVALALAFTDWALSFQPGVTEANVKRIKPGMTMVEVERILGEAGQARVTITEGGREISAFQWTGPGAVAYVLFDEPGPGRRTQGVRTATFHPVAGSGPFARLRAWLGW
jgi:hypothetical protein